MKAIIDLQTAVNANDTANIPAKVAAAQAVAETKEDRYLIGQMQLKAALASKDNAALAVAIDAVAKSGMPVRPTLLTSTSRLAALTITPSSSIRPPPLSNGAWRSTRTTRTFF